MEEDKSYERLPYKSKTYKHTNPSYQRYIAHVKGLKTNEIENARVLEMGCSFGGNIIPFAVGYENSEVIGIDLSKVQVDKGNEIIKGIGIDNIKLYNMNILDYNQEFGLFDYIICHGVYSWVPEIVQDKILDVIKKSLKPNGIAHVSYNTYPGWKSIEIYRDSALFRLETLKDQNIDLDESTQVLLSRKMANFIKEQSFMDEHIKEKSEGILSGEEHYIYHEYLEVFNKPQYFNEFVEKIEEKGLKYVSDTVFTKCIIPSDISEILDLECGDDDIAKEQYLDFKYNIQFRNSLITHGDNSKKLLKLNDVTIRSFENLYVKQKTRKEESKIDEILNKIYPKSIQIKDLIKIDGVDVFEVLKKIVLNKFETSLENTDKEYVGNLKLKDRVKRYIQQLLKDEMNYIYFSEKNGSQFELGIKDLEFLLYFNGENSIEDMKKILKEKIDKGEYSEFDYISYLEGTRDMLISYSLVEESYD